MPQASLNALLAAYRDQAEWLEAQASEFAAGRRRILAISDSGIELDMCAETVAEYRHKAGNLRAIILAYERLHSMGK